MDFGSILNVKAMGIGIACAGVGMALVAAGEFLLGRKGAWKLGALALVPLALGAGFVAHHAAAFEFPKSADGRPWYLDQMWKMPVIAAMLAAVLLAIARILPQWISLIPLGLAIAGATLLCVRGPWVANEAFPAWEHWPLYAAGLAGGLVAYFACAWPVWRDPRLWAVGILSIWAGLSGTAVAFLTTFEQRLGRMLVLAAILAGIAAAAGILPRMRSLVGAAVPFLAVVLGTVLCVGCFYDLSYPEPPMVARAVFLLACAPLGMGIAWIPALRRRPWTCAILAVALACGLAAAGTALALLNAPPPGE
jgi:hypothetical protein